jgi:hypothetical protein
LDKPNKKIAAGINLEHCLSHSLFYFHAMWKIEKPMVIYTQLETAIQCLGNSAYLQNLELRSSSRGVDKLNGGKKMSISQVFKLAVPNSSYDNKTKLK